MQGGEGPGIKEKKANARIAFTQAFMEETKMIIANNATYKSFISNYNHQNSKLSTSMSRLSKGQRIVGPGDAPADLGISERFRAQIRNTEEAGRVIQNAINMFQTTDTWLQEIHSILNRMSELSIAAADGSKSQADRKNLDLEFQQLKSEVARISEAGKYNGLQINSKTAVSIYDTQDKKLYYTQSDGTDQRELAFSFRDGNTATNGVEYAFEASAQGQIGDFMFTEDGKSLLYIAQKDAGANVSARKTLMKLDIESNTLQTVMLTSAGGTSATLQARLIMDEKGRVWISDPDAQANSAAKQFNIRLLNIDEMTLDAGGTGATNKWSGGVSAASSFSNFAVHDDYIYYIERSAAGAPLRYVKQSIFDTSGREILLNDLSGTLYDMEIGEDYAISHDGQYIAFEDEDTAGTLVVINAFSGEKSELRVGTRANSIVGLEFDHNNRLFWTDTGGTSDENAMKTATIRSGDKPDIINAEVIINGNAGRFGVFNSANAALGFGFSVKGGSPAANYEFQVGADAGMDVSFEAADVRLVKLGISSLDVMSFENAKEAIGKVGKAIDLVANQRAVIGSEVSRLTFTYSANNGYGDNISQAESRIRDVDVARESSELTNAQVLTQVGTSILAQANQSKQNVLRLLQ